VNGLSGKDRTSRDGLGGRGSDIFSLHCRLGQSPFDLSVGAAMPALEKRLMLGESKAFGGF